MCATASKPLLLVVRTSDGLAQGTPELVTVKTIVCTGLPEPSLLLIVRLKTPNPSTFFPKLNYLNSGLVSIASVNDDAYASFYGF